MLVKPDGIQKEMGCGSELLDAHNVRVIGNGSQVLVFGHGFGSDQSAWQFVVPYFANDHKVVLYDLMGAGCNNQNNFNFARYATLHAYADDLLMILDEMQIESCIFVGHSMSGMIGCIASIERPQVFRKIVLLSSSPRSLSVSDSLSLFLSSLLATGQHQQAAAAAQKNRSGVFVILICWSILSTLAGT
jgi:pimeloyl-ACP methyl ester carboxylesterase